MTEQKRGRGRPKGSRNKRKYVSAIDSLDDLTPKAVEKLEQILDQKISGTTPAQVFAAAKLVIELAEKQYEKELLAEEGSEDTPKESAEDTAPVIRLTAV